MAERILAGAFLLTVCVSIAVEAACGNPAEGPLERILAGTIKGVISASVLVVMAGMIMFAVAVLIGQVKVLS